MNFDQYRLSAKERGYRVPGKHLLPRCSFDASELEYMGLRSSRALRRSRAEDARVQRGHGTCSDAAPHWARVWKALEALSTRRRKVVEAALEDGSDAGDRWGAAMRRAFDAAVQAERIENAMEWDRKTLANAY